MYLKPVHVTPVGSFVHSRPRFRTNDKLEPGRDSKTNEGRFDPYFIIVRDTLIHPSGDN